MDFAPQWGRPTPVTGKFVSASTVQGSTPVTGKFCLRQHGFGATVGKTDTGDRLSFVGTVQGSTPVTGEFCLRQHSPGIDAGDR